MRRSGIVVCALAATLAGSTPAVASSSPVYPEMHFEPAVTLRDSRGKIVGYRLCAKGDASFLYVFGAWDYRMDGTRATASGSPGPVIAQRDSTSGWPTYSGCLTATRLGYQTGHVHATFSYNGVGGNVPYTIEHTFTWCEGCPNPTLGLGLSVEDLQVEVDPL